MCDVVAGWVVVCDMVVGGTWVVSDYGNGGRGCINSCGLVVVLVGTCHHLWVMVGSCQSPVLICELWWVVFIIGGGWWC